MNKLTQKVKYTVENYNPEWVNKFQEIKVTLEKVFGSKVLDIHHVGSTSVPGMRAKPLIDVLVIVKEWEDFENEINLMKEQGYEFERDRLVPNSLLFFKSQNGHKIENIHILEKEAEKINEFLDIRDYLRTHPEKAEAYGNLKEKLLVQYPNDYFAYRAGKQDFLGELKRLAKEWRNKTES